MTAENLGKPQLGDSLNDVRQINFKYGAFPTNEVGTIAQFVLGKGRYESFYQNDNQRKRKTSCAISCGRK